MVVASSHFFSPFVVEDNVQSSEDGSGLHSPTFLDSDSIRPPPPDIDIHNVAGILASHFAPYGAYPIHSYNLDNSFSHRFSSRSHISPPSPNSYFPHNDFNNNNSYNRPLVLPALLPSPHDSRSPMYEDASPISPLDGPFSSGSRPSSSSTSQLSALPQSHSQSEPSSSSIPGPSTSPSISNNNAIGGSSSSSQPVRREPSLVVIACRQCRARKIRCDSTRPACHNCIRRQNECAYDAVPKRRGPDKRPGTRTRSCKKRPPADPANPAAAVISSGAASSSAASTPGPGPQSPAKKKRKASTSGGGTLLGVNPDEGGGALSPGGAMSGIESEGIGGGGGGVGGGGGGNTTSTTSATTTATTSSLNMNAKPNMGLRLDTSFARPSNGAHNPSAYGDNLGSAHHLHAYTHHPHHHPHHHQLSPHPHSHPFQYSPSATSSPTTTLSFHSHTHTPMPRSAVSPVLTLPKPQSPPHRRGPFSMYEDLSPGSTATTLNDGSENRAFPLDLNLPPHHTHTPTTTTSARDERVYLSPAHTHISPTHSHHVAAVAHSHVSPVTHYGLGINVNVNLNGVNALSAAAATVEFNSKLWWDNLLNQYSPNREQSEAQVFEDISSLFSASIHWLSFLNTNHFLRKLYDPTEREKMSPSLVLAALALATLLKSSELQLGANGRARAIWLRDGAQAYLENAWAASMVDPQLAQAAMLVAVFEASAHPQHTAQRACEALLFLDRIIHALSLTRIDAADPSASLFAPCSVPSVPRAYPNTSRSSVSVNDTVPSGSRTSTTASSIGSGLVTSTGLATSSVNVNGAEDRLYCAPPVHSPALDIGRMSPTWASSLRWDAHWSKEEIEAEETRRLCWAALSLAAAHTAHCAAFHREPLDLFICRPENYALLFPNEREDGSGAGKQSVWALYCRSMLLWNSCLQLRKSSSDNEKAEFAMQAWVECNAIQDLIDEHRARQSDSHLLYMTSEHVFNTRIAVQHEFRRLQDLGVGSTMAFNRRQAEEWLHYQSQTAKHFEHILHDARDSQAQVLARRPFYVWWFMNQFAISMSLWEHDKSLVQALDLCKTFLVPIDILSTLWPCEAQRERYLQLREELAEHCKEARLPPPPPPDFQLPISLR